jgi:hypothetical protein
VTITGVRFDEASAVKFGATNAASFTVNSDSSITAISPAGSGTVDVTVTTPGGNGASPGDHFTYVPAGPAPKIKKIAPKTGPAAGGTTVEISGTNFAGATAVSFGSTSATSYTVNSASSITAVSPASTSGQVALSVTTPNGTSAPIAADHFNYGPPTITEVSPNSGSVSGGTTVTITGTGFALGSATNFLFGGMKGSSVNCTSTSTCTVVSPARKAGTVDVKAGVSGKHSAANAPADQFSFTKP